MACSTTSSRLAVCAIPTVGINHADRTALSIMGLIFTDDSLFLDPNSWFFSWGSILRRSIFDRTARENFFVRESVHRHLLPGREAQGLVEPVYTPDPDGISAYYRVQGKRD